LCLYTHIVAGALAGAVAPHPVWAPFFGLGSHVVLDAFPHYDFEKVSHEITLGLVVFFLLALSGWMDGKAFLGAVFGAVPDFENLLWKKGVIPGSSKVFPSHSGLVPHGRELGRSNLLVQTALVLVFAILLAEI
jgi:hypothetical protein